MVRAGDAVVFEDWIGLGVFFSKRIGLDAVMLEKRLDFHKMLTTSDTLDTPHRGVEQPRKKQVIRQQL